jgi:small-conductance mechanosensitive channel
MENADTAFSISSLLYEEGSAGIFLLVTIILGGGAAWLTGRAIAGTWRPPWQVIVYSLLLGAAVRFIHMALFGGTLLSLHYYAVDTVICLVFGYAGFQAARAAQMARQYGWLIEKHGAMRWRRKTP